MRSGKKANRLDAPCIKPVGVPPTGSSSTYRNQANRSRARSTPLAEEAKVRGMVPYFVTQVLAFASQNIRAFERFRHKPMLSSKYTSGSEMLSTWGIAGDAGCACTG